MVTNSYLKKQGRYTQSAQSRSGMGNTLLQCLWLRYKLDLTPGATPGEIIN